jgi:hypothetical protein
MPNKWHIESDGKGGFVPPELAPESDQAEFLHRLRPIVLDKERTSFKNVSAMLRKALDHEYFTLQLTNLKKQYDSDESQQLFQIYSNDVRINCKEALNAWLNGLEYHQDLAKADAIEKSFSGLPIELQTAIYIDMLRDKALAALNLAGLIGRIIGSPAGQGSSAPSPNTR